MTVPELDCLEVPVVCIEPDTVPEELIVLDCETELVRVVEPVEVLELEELPENVVVAVCVLDCAADFVKEPVPVIVAVCDGLLLGAKGPVLVAEIEFVIVCDLEIRPVTEEQGLAVDVLLAIPVLDEVAVIEGVAVFLLIVRVGVKESFKLFVLLLELLEHGLAVGVLLELILFVLVLV